MATQSLNKKWIFATVILLLLFFLMFQRKIPLFSITNTLQLNCGGQELPLIHSALLTKEPFIIGGTVATTCPWMVKLGQGILCGGCLIHPQWVLTSGHCGINQGSTAILGAKNFLIQEPAQQRIKIQQIIRHPKFGIEPLTTIPNDIMLIKLAKPAIINENIYPICLPGNWDLKGRNLIVYGWGNTSATEEINISAQLLQLTVKEAETCKYSINHNTQLCTTASNAPLQTTCFGDSGGPLVLHEFNKNFVVGLVSWGAQGTCENYTVFTRVSHFVPWIRQITGI